VVDIIVKSKNCEVPGRLKEAARSKAAHATRFFDRLDGIEMVFREEANPRIAEAAVVEVTARTKGHHIRAEGVAEDHRSALDVAVGRFERQLSRYKARLVARRRGAGRRAPAATGVAAGTAAVAVAPSGHGQASAEPPPRIVRTKRFSLTPMLPEEAAWQLELLGHDFYVFTNAGDGRQNVIYRRRDGDFGLIEPAD